MARTLNLQQRQERLGWWMMAPTLLVLLLVGLYPLIQTFAISLTDARLGSAKTPQFIGLKNYIKLMSNSDFWAAIWNTVVFTISSVTVEFFLGLAIALIIHSQFKGRGLVRAAILIPWALPTVVSAKMWSYMLVDTYGVINDILVTRTGLLSEKIAWLGHPGLSMAAIVAVDVWKTTPFVALLLLAGLQLIPDQIYEAAKVDGASHWQQFTRITLPMLRPAIYVTLIFRTLDALRVFDVIWVMTRGQAGTESMATFNYRYMIDFRRLGFGSAVSVTIFLVIAVFVIFYLLAFRKEDPA